MRNGEVWLRIILPIFILVVFSFIAVHCTASDDDDDSSDDNDLDDDDGRGSPADQADGIAPFENTGQCSDFNPLKNLYFGDLHAHTHISFDAYGYDVRATFDEAWAFAKGDRIYLAPLDDEGNPTRPVELSRPLDFAALSDHIEFFAEVHLCTTPGNNAYDSPSCKAMREGGSSNVTKYGIRLANPNPSRMSDICNAEGIDCDAVAADVWKSYVEAAVKAQDKSDACSFTAFPAYEYTGTPYVSNLHRNVIFKNGNVPENPISYFEQSDPIGLLKTLKNSCQEGVAGCDVISIPHNPNWSNGRLFMPDGSGTLEEQRYRAELRAEMEPIVEIMQHKGNQECKNGFPGIADDPLCSFEQFREDDFKDCGERVGMGGANSLGCLSRYDYLRSILNLGLAEQKRLGVNPYKLGVIGSTDTHNGIPGMTEEIGYPGHVGNVDDTSEKNLSLGTLTHTPLYSNPGGLIAAWAEENSRNALFESFRNKEVYSTSGTRISVRFFGGWNFDEGMCSGDDFAKVGYAQGVPMGGDLPQASKDTNEPIFAVQAFYDAGTEEAPGTLLQRIQIIKGWIDDGGDIHEKVFEVAGNPANGAGVEEETCEQYGDGFESLCAVWTDEEFDPGLPAFYYARVVENPSCRWSTRVCNEFAENNRPETCEDPRVEKVIQERAVTSPIWFEGESFYK